MLNIHFIFLPTKSEFKMTKNLKSLLSEENIQVLVANDMAVIKGGGGHSGNTGKGCGHTGHTGKGGGHSGHTGKGGGHSGHTGKGGGHTGHTGKGGGWGGCRPCC
jgi:hypothetical protein